MVLLASCENVIKQVCKEVFLVCFRATRAKLTWQPRCVTETLKCFFINWKPCKSMSACWLLGSKLSGDYVHIPSYFIPHHIYKKIYNYPKQERTYFSGHILISLLMLHGNLVHSCHVDFGVCHELLVERDQLDDPMLLIASVRLSGFQASLFKSPPHPSTLLLRCVASLQLRVCTPHP